MISRPWFALSALIIAWPGLAMAGRPAPTSINFHAVSHYQVPRTELDATLQSTATRKHPAPAAAVVNQKVSWAFSQLRQIKGLHWRTQGYSTYQSSTKPVRWQVSETITVHTQDPQSLLPLLGTLQSRLHLTGLHYQASRRSTQQAEQAATVRALHRYRLAALSDCNAVGYASVRFGSLFINTNQPPVFRPGQIMMAAVRAVPGPVAGKGGEEQGRVLVGGTAYCLSPQT